jgi:UDP-N-acetyl-D-mannosaminuronic acid dehydrogenase
MNNIIVIGLGAVGLPVAEYLRHVRGKNVIGVDKKYENDGVLIRKEKLNWEYESLLVITDDINNTFPVVNSINKLKNFKPDAVIVCIGLDIDERKNIVWAPFIQLIKEIGEALRKWVTKPLISIETTIPIRTMRNKVLPILTEYSGKIAGADFFLSFAPERISIGRQIENMKEYPRLVAGYSEECCEEAYELYSIFTHSLQFCSFEEAETTKLVENAYRDVNIAFANEVSEICRDNNVDWRKVRLFVNGLPNRPELGENKNPVRNMHFAGTGVGGYCLPKDSYLLIKKKNEDETESEFCMRMDESMIRKARKFNEDMPERIIKRIKDISIKIENILLLGLSDIPNIKDERCVIVNQIEYEFRTPGGVWWIYDPVYGDYVSKLDSRKKYIFDVVILVTEHDIFKKELKPEIFDELQRNRFIMGPIKIKDIFEKEDSE